MAAQGSVAAINILWLDISLYIFNKPIMSVVHTAYNTNKN